MSEPVGDSLPPADTSADREDTELCVPMAPELRTLPTDEPQGTHEAPEADLEALRRELAEKAAACAALVHANEELKAMLDTLQSDSSAQRAEKEVELRTLAEALQRVQSEQLELVEELDHQRSANKELKRQSLQLQHQVNAWGIPLSTQAGSRHLEEQSSECSFPALTPLDPSIDPIPTALRGEVSAFHIADVLHILASCRLEGVLTVVSGPLACKLYIERSALRLAAWSNVEPELRLSALLEASGLVPPETVAAISGEVSFDLELARRLAANGEISRETVRLGLQEHARVILGYLLHCQQGDFFFQRGHLSGCEDLLFRLPITSILLTAAAAADERTERALRLESGSSR